MSSKLIGQNTRNSSGLKTSENTTKLIDTENKTMVARGGG